MDDLGNQTDLVATFLAERDAACPVCGYNLRAVSGGQCPECGEGLTLGLRHPGGLWRRRGLLLLVFGFLSLAGLMQSVLAGRAVHATLTRSPQTIWMQALNNLTTTGNLAFNPLAPSGAPTTLTLKNGSPPKLLTIPAPLVGSTTRGSGPTGSGSFQFSFAMPPGPATGTGTGTGWQWSSVGWQQWTGLGGWSLLTIVSIAGLVMALTLGRRHDSPLTIRLLVALAWIGCASYLGYQAYAFLRALG